MEKPKCEGCVYWEKLHEWKSTRGDSGWIGDCKRYAPLLKSNREKADYDFCGEHPDFPKWVKECQK